jgi:spore coat polysaccharide biosynthesis protein SpsF (cytidylyltransferase family)
MKKVSVIIQARTGARRLPNKVLLKLAGKSVLEHVVDRVSAAKTVGEVIVATTTEPRDRKIVELAKKKGFRVFRGSESDVLDRYYQAAQLLKAEHVTRITADCPVIDPVIIDRVVKEYFKSGADYCSNSLTSTFPDGQDVEVFSFEALAKAWQNAKLTSEREHVTPYIRNKKNRFKIASVESPVDLSGKRWTLDEEKDYEFLKGLFKALYRRKPRFGMTEILEYLDGHPELEQVNRAIVRNEGYARSLKQDKVYHG